MAAIVPTHVSPPTAPHSRGGGPVLLATLDVPFADDACAVAVGAAAETGRPLVIANVVELPPLGMSVQLGYDRLGDAPDLAASLAAAARSARNAGVRVERVRVKSMRPVEALLELATDCNAGLLVFGPDRKRVGRLRLLRALRAIERRAACLVWTG